jgi:hypothetical protein
MCELDAVALGVSLVIEILIVWGVLSLALTTWLVIAGTIRSRDRRRGPGDRRVGPRNRRHGMPDRRRGLPDPRPQAVERRRGPRDRRAGAPDRRKGRQDRRRTPVAA